MKPPSRWILLMVIASGRLAAQDVLTPRDSARHALDRLGYGPTPGKVDAIARTGVMKWIEAQIEVDSPVDPALRTRELRYEALTTPTAELVAMHAAQVRRALQAPRDSGSTRRLPAVAADATGAGRRDLRQVNGQLMSLVMLRAIESERQLGEVLTDFWLNHFNVFVNKGFTRAYFRDHLEVVIRANAMGTFGALLLATARSPAMLFYLDNAQSVAAGASLAAPRGRPQRAGRGVMPAPPQRMARGLNENYARELLELHTLGVDGGYTQDDIVAVARILTGWGIGRDRGLPGFIFTMRAHDAGGKQVMGTVFGAGGGIEEGERLLSMLASHPATMHHVATKLCARFVADAAPDGCVDDAVRAWKASGGDIRRVVGAIVHGPDFWSSASMRSKVKTPLEFVASAVRALGGVPDETPRLAQQVARLGQPLFQQSAPTGYPESQADWVNSGALLGRMNFAVALAGGRIPGVTVDLDRLLPDTPDDSTLVAEVDRVVLDGMMTDRTRATIVRELAGLQDRRQARALAVGLAIGGPEFQRQ